MGADAMREIAALIDRVLSAPEDRDTIAAVKADVKALADAYPLYRSVARV
jgi:glycine hydroxymethyltransferase